MDATTPDRIASDHAGEAGEVFACDRTSHRACGAGKESKYVGDSRDLIALHRRERFAAVARLELGKRIGVRFDTIGQLEQQCGAILRRGSGPAVQCAGSGEHCCVHLLFGGLCNFRDHLAGRRIEDFLHIALAGGELALDQKLGLHVGLIEIPSRDLESGGNYFDSNSRGRVR